MFEALRERPTVRTGILYGGLAWIGGLLLVLLLILVSSGPYSSAMARIPIISATGYWSALHGWAAIVDGNASLLVLGVVPASVLLSVGYYAARSTAGAREPGYVRGAWIAGGYAPLVVLSYGWVILRLSGFAGGAGAIGGGIGNPLSLLVPILVTGVLFPAFFGGLGGHVAEWRLGN